MNILAFILFTLFTNLSNPGIKDTDIFELSGLVVEESSGEPLTGALIQIEGLEKELYTDFDGSFSINAFKSGKYDIRISYTSFESVELKDLQLDPKNSHLFVSLR